MPPTMKAEDRRTSGHRLSHPAPGEEVFITGISGCFPDSDSVVHLQENLFNKMDLLSKDNRRWNITHPEIPERSGKINNVNKFDASFFGVHYKQAHSMDPMCRILLEKTYEAIIDAGLNPNELRNTKTGVFIGATFSESEKIWYYDKMDINGFGVSSCSRAMLASRISNWLGVTGPSFNVDSACSSSSYAFEHAFRAIRDGRCDTAIVGGCNLSLHPVVSLQFSRLGVLSPDGRCKSFDNGGNGYARSEAIVVCLLQKAKDSRRVYAQVVYAKTNCDGFKEQGITYPGGRMQKLLLSEFYEESSVTPNSVEFVEAHGTGTTVGDPEELNAIGEVFCAGRSEPLLIGSVKSNLGHSEPVSGLCSVAKLCIAYSTGYIPPNINYKIPRRGVTALEDGRLKVVTEKQPWGRGMAGINSFGFGGANAHILLKNVAKTKVNHGLPLDSLPRLVCASGRTEAAVARILDELESRTVDAELVRLLHAIHDEDIKGHVFRGYTLLGSSPTNSVPFSRNVQKFSRVRRPLWFIYSGMGSQGTEIASQLMRIPVFAAAIEKCHKVLEPKGINLIKNITDPDLKIYDNILYSITSIVAVQIGLTDVLETVGIKPDFVTGHSESELLCAYADGCLTLEQLILSAYSRDLASIETTAIEGSMAIVDPGYNENPVFFEEISRLIPENAVAIEIGLPGLLQETLHKCFKKNVIIVTLIEKKQNDNVNVLFRALGKLYEAGLNPHLANIYPRVQFPVSQGTPMIAPLVEWDHSEDWYVAKHDVTQSELKSAERTVIISIESEESEYITGHVIDGRNLYPGTGYLVMVWETLGMMLKEKYYRISVVFENVRFQRATNIPKEGNLEFIVMIQKGSGQFEIVESGASIVTGRIYAKKNVGQHYSVLPDEPEVTGLNVKHLLSKDFYKELRLRGYQYSGLFRSVIGCNVEGTRGRLVWNNNWVTFMDCMLQMKIIGQDTRGLVVPTRIEKLCIDTNMHYDAISKMNPNSTKQQSFEVRVYPKINVTRAGGVEIHGLHATPISKRIPLGVPVLEKNVFIPNIGKSMMTIEDVLRSNIQIILENIQAYKIKSIECVDEEYKTCEFETVMEKVADVLSDLPLLQAELFVYSEKPVKLPANIVVENKKPIGDNNTDIYIGANLLKRPDVLKQTLSTLRDTCYIISREKEPINPKEYAKIINIITIQKTGFEYMVLFKKRVGSKQAKYVEVATADNFEWIEKIKKNLKLGQKIVIYSQDEPINGLLGLINCLRKEPGGEMVNGLLISDVTAPKFNPDVEFYKEQLNKNLAINVYQEGEWGTYRHLLLGDLDTVQAHHAFVNTLTIGDLSSLRWLEGPIKKDTILNSPESILIHVYCAALNFRDVMTATGRVSVDAVVRGRLAQECVQGFEVVGKTSNGTRVMGMVSDSGLANMVICDRSAMWCIPDEWSFEEAATVPVTYGTAYYAMIMVAKIQRGESILIHAGSGGVGQAAINLALHYGCEVFTTVGTPEKRAFIKKLFPQLKDSHIGNSRDISFKDMIVRETNGKGVNVVLNSLSDEKLQASVSCLSYRGRFLEIGKFDMSNNTPINMYTLHRETTFYGIVLDFMFNQNNEFRKNLRDLLISGIETGAVRPLTYCTFEKNEIETAFRYMASGKHIGKVIIKIRDEERSNFPTKPTNYPIDAVPRYTCSEDQVYVIVGGLGGFGLELADWLILRGARRVLLTSRRGITNGYQSSRLRAWSGYGVNVQISIHDITKEEGCEKMLKKALTMGPVEAIFNLAVILRDSIFQNQTPETFKTSFAPKAMATMNLDKLSRQLCPGLKNFVVFSSVSCGRGNAGQTNYGFSNSVMERICESRKRTGLPALAVQWGAVGDVGLVADMQDDDIQLEIGGTLQQRISSCLLSLDKFLRQDAVIVSSIVVAEKKAINSGCGSIVDAVSQIMGIRDLKTVSQQVSLAELGMDSMMAVEIKQTLEREFEIFLASQDVKTLTFARLVDLTAHNESGASTSISAHQVNLNEAAGLRVLMRNFGDEKLAVEPFIYMSTMVSNGSEADVPIHENEVVMFMLPGIEGSAAGMVSLCRWLKIKVYVLQFGLEFRKDTLENLVDRLHKVVKSRLKPRMPYVLLGYSFGTLPLLKLAEMLEIEGHQGQIFCIDGSPDFMHALITKELSFKSDKDLQNSLLCHTINLIAPNNNITGTLLEELKEIESYDERIAYAMKSSPSQLEYSESFIESIEKAVFDRLNMILKPLDIKKLKAPIIVLRTKENSFMIEENYGLDKFTEGPVTVHLLEDTHAYIIENKNCADIINEVLSKQGGI